MEICMADEFDDDSIKSIKEMIKYWNASKIVFWLIIGVGMLALTVYGVMNLLRLLRSH